MSSSFSGTLRARTVTTVSGRITTWQMATTSIIVGISPSRPDAPGPVTCSMPGVSSIESDSRKWANA